MMMASSRLELLSAFDAQNVLESQSTAFVYGESPSPESPLRLPLFESLPISVSHDDGDPTVVDGLLFAGGLCNTLDWCPQNSETHIQTEYLALSCHPKHLNGHHIGTASHGQGIVQLWAIETRIQSGGCSMRMCQGLVHNGSLCCHLQWCPDPSAFVSFTAPPMTCLGLLAMALGNGDIYIAAIPEPTSETRFIEVEPRLVITRQQMGGSLVSCLDWHPVAPHDHLLLGCWDGTVSIWALPQNDSHEAEQLLQHRIDLLALRRVVWIKPPDDHLAKIDLIYHHTFCSVGHSGHFSIWDRRNMFQPVLDWTLTRCWLLDADVSHSPLTVYCALEDASIRQLPLEMLGFTHQLDQSVFHVYSGHNKGAIHAVSCSPCNALVAYGGEDGEIAVLVKENVGDTRYRKPHVCAGSMKYDTHQGVLKVYTAGECSKIGGVYIGGAMFAVNKPTLPSPITTDGSAFDYQTIRCIKFSPNGQDTTWLAVGYVTGFVRLLKITE